MIEGAAPNHPADSIESVLREDLAHGDAMLGTIAPILRHLLANDDHSVFGDDVIARVRGMTAAIARALLDELAAAQGNPERPEPDADQLGFLIESIVGIPAFLSHVHALALEWQLTERQQARLASDPVVSPLLQAQLAASDPNMAGLAMNVLAAQVRYCQSQRRMSYSWQELPGELLHGSLIALRTVAGDGEEVQAAAAAAESTIRARYNEGGTRLGLITRLLTGMGAGAVSALSITHAGTAIFLSALSLATGQDRDVSVLSTNESQLARLSLALRASGLRPETIEEQFLALHPDIALPEGFERIGADRAAAILALSGRFGGA